jgi:hypothetical protein
MNTFSPRTTYSLLLVMFMIIGGMYYMSDVLHIESYREDHHIGVEDGHEVQASAHSKSDHESSTPVKNLVEDSKPEQQPTESDSLINEVISFDMETEGELSPSSVMDDSDPTSFFDQLIENYRNTTLAGVPETESRTDLVVRYYPHDSDEGRVKVLSEYGFYLHERSVENDNAEYQSNSIFYGDNIKTEDIQVIAYLLIKNGVPIKQIIPSKFHDGWKANSVEIGADINIDQQPVLTLGQVQSFSNPYLNQ